MKRNVGPYHQRTLETRAKTESSQLEVDVQLD